jgi:cysteinyl-tRNA synthetase
MLRLYNSLTKQKEHFAPLDGRQKLTGRRKTKTKLVTMYNCGPTVYDYVHIGNLRSFLIADLLRRYLEFSGYKVRQVMNITDVGHMTSDAEAGEDKLEVAARREKKSPWEIAEFFTQAFFDDIKKLNFKLAWKYPRATDHIKEMIRLVEKLIKNGFAYERNGSVYFDLSKFPNYGKLSGNTVDDLLAGARVEVVSEKKNPYDFALWIEKPKHAMQWKAPWSRVAGYPGWHLECSAMSMKYLGETFDIHTGGEDNKFPHHECEIAQSEGATGKQFVRYWLHVKHLMIEGEKMSKSKGNFYTLKDVLDKGYSPRTVRYLLLSTHYRDPLNFTFDGLSAAEEALCRLDELWTKLDGAAKVLRGQNGKKAKGLPPRTKGVLSLQHIVQESREDFIRAMDDDLNISKALAVLFNFAHKVNAALSSAVDRADLVKVRRLLKEFDSVFGFGFRGVHAEKIPAKIKKLLEEREQARASKDWKRADELRSEIFKLGYVVEDTAEGPKVKLKVKN